jgi:hypothetical protein
MPAEIGFVLIEVSTYNKTAGTLVDALRRYSTVK